MWTELQIREAGARFMGYRVADWLPQVEWVNGADPKQLARYESYQRGGMEVLLLSIGDLSGVALLGPVPTGDDRWNWTGAEFGNRL